MPVTVLNALKTKRPKVLKGLIAPWVLKGLMTLKQLRALKAL